MLTDIALFLTGIIVGGLNSIAGGGIVGYPILLMVGLHPLIADATSYVAALPGHLSSVWGYRHFLRKVPRLYLWLLSPCAVGSAIGAHFLAHATPAGFEKLVPLLVLIAVGLSFLQPFLHIHLMSHVRNHHRFNFKFVLLVLACLVLMVYGGFFGVGISFSLLTSIGMTRIHERHMMNGMKNIAAIVVMAVAIMSIADAHIIHWHDGLIVGAGSLIGGYLGARLSLHRLPMRSIRAGAIVIGTITITYLLIRYH